MYCTVCQKKEGDDFLLCDACDGGMHRQCAKLDHIPASGFWACTICKERPTVESAIRQARPDIAPHYSTWGCQLTCQNVIDWLSDMFGELLCAVLEVLLTTGAP